MVCRTAPAARRVSHSYGCRRDRIEASFREAISIAKEQKSISLENAPKQPTQNIAGKKRARQEDVDSDYLFDNAKREIARITQHPLAKDYPS